MDSRDDALPRRSGRPPVPPSGRRNDVAASSGRNTLVISTVTALIVGAAGGWLVGHRTSPSVQVSPFARSTDIGAVAPGSGAPTPQATADLGQPIARGSLSITASGPVTAVRDGGSGPGLMVTFQISMRNASGNGYVEGPASFEVRCDANRTADVVVGADWSDTTAGQSKRVSAGQTATGSAVVTWLDWNHSVRCTGPTTLEAVWSNAQFVAWTLPPDVVAQVNAKV